MLKNKKGFTLVELLAVIVILAIILAIAVPGIAGIINSAKRGAFESDAKMIVTGIEYRLLESSVDTTVTKPTVNITTPITNIADYGANPANYTGIYIVDLNPITICVESTAASEFGAYAAASTKTSVTYLTAPTDTCALWAAAYTG